jgi:hypothetical protein
MELYQPFVRLSDEETWVELKHFGVDLEFESPSQCQQWIDNMYPGRVRCDVFHGLQPIQVVRTR